MEAAAPLIDQTATANDYSPLQQERSWTRQAEDSVVEKMERMGLMAPSGNADKVLETVVNNLEVTNDLDIEPGVRCRVLMTSTLESFAIGHTIVLSRGLVDVLPDEASLAAILAHELGHIVLGHRMNTEFAFFNRLRFNDKDTFRHFGFAHTPDDERAASQTGIELLSKSPYKDQLRNRAALPPTLQNDSKEIPNLISPSASGQRGSNKLDCHLRCILGTAIGRKAGGQRHSRSATRRTHQDRALERPAPDD